MPTSTLIWPWLRPLKSMILYQPHICWSPEARGVKSTETNPSTLSEHLSGLFPQELGLCQTLNTRFCVKDINVHVQCNYSGHAKQLCEIFFWCYLNKIHKLNIFLEMCFFQVVNIFHKLTLVSWYKSSELSLVSFWWSQMGLSEFGNTSVNVGSSDSAVW